MSINLEHIGQKIRETRLRQKKTQQQIANVCGISKSLLSKIENGLTSSAVATLSKISQALDIPLSWVIDDRPETDIVLLPSNQREYVVGDVEMGYSFELLANRSKFSQIEPTIVHVTPKDANTRLDPYTHSQDEFIYILEGEILLFYDGEEHHMKEEDSAYFKGTKPHLFVPVDNRGARILTIFIEET